MNKLDQIVNLFKWVLGMQEKRSGSIAKDRMKMMVIHDREQLPPEQVAKMKLELLEVMSKYLDIDPENAECIIESNDDRSAFITTNVPLVPKSTRGSKQKAKAK